jgi:hypothetical protein
VPRKTSVRIDNPEHRAVYHLVSSGQMHPHVVPLYRRQLSHLADAGVIKRTPEGAYEIIPGDALTPSSPPPPPAEEMVTVSVRVPVAVAQALEAMGPTRSEAARAILGRALGSGVRKAVG